MSDAQSPVGKYPPRPNDHSIWMTRSNLWLDLRDPDYSLVEAHEFPLAMRNCARFSGLLPDEVTVHEANLLVHSMFVADILEHTLGVTDQKMIRTALMHDAHEIVCQDVSRPAKVAMRNPLSVFVGSSDYDRFEDAHKRALALRFDLYYPHPKVVAEADALALAWEMTNWFGADWYEAEGMSCGRPLGLDDAVARRSRAGVVGFMKRLGEPMVPEFRTGAVPPVSEP